MRFESSSVTRGTAFSPGWMKWDALVMEMLAPVGAEIIRALALRDDNEHLDIGSGTGEPGLSIAAVVPRGRVVLTDLFEHDGQPRLPLHARCMNGAK